MNKDTNDIFDIAIIGGGGGGTMAFLRSTLNYDRSIFLTGSNDTRKRCRATWVSEVQNIPGFHGLRKPITTTARTTLDWIHSNEKLRDIGTVESIEAKEIYGKENEFTIIAKVPGETDRQYKTRYILVATGVMDIQPKINGSIEPILPFANNGDVFYCMRCDGHRTADNDLSVIGYTDTALNTAVILKERYNHKKIYILTNGHKPIFSEKLIALGAQYNFIIIEDEITEILGTPKKEGLQGYNFRNHPPIKTTKTIISLGVIPYNSLLAQMDCRLSSDGRAIVNEKMESSTPGLFVVGDLASGHKMQIYTIWDCAVNATDEINLRLRLERRSKILR